MTTGTYTTETQTGEPCRCCHGSGTQENRQTRITIICPCCNGAGIWPVRDYSRQGEYYNYPPVDTSAILTEDEES